MRSSHNLPLTAQGAVTKLLEFIEARQDARPTGDIEQFEREVRALVMEVERELVQEELALYDIDTEVIEVDGIKHRRVQRCAETYFGAAGELRITRSLYSTREDGARCVCPMELRAGILEGRWTPLAAKQATWAVAQMTPQECEDLFRMMGGMSPSKSSLDRLPKLLGQRWEEERLHFDEQLRISEPIPPAATILAVSLDGVMLPMKDPRSHFSLGSGVSKPWRPVGTTIGKITPVTPPTRSFGFTRRSGGLSRGTSNRS